jgi:uncharacterized protein YeaO (DUF488 family)
MTVRIVRLGTDRIRGEGLRIGTVRRPPRGVKKEDFASRNFYDVWLPELSPSAELVSKVQSAPITPATWSRFEKAYRKEMASPASQHLLALVAAMSRQTNLSVGCYCEEETHCHRSILRELLRDAGAVID